MENKKTVLVIEDETTLRNALTEKMLHEGFGVLGAKDGEEGLDIALRQHPDLILLDIIMPKMDGMTMLEKLRTDGWGKKVHVIMLTNLGYSEKIADAIKNEAFDYFIKSGIKIDEVIAKIKEKLEV